MLYKFELNKLIFQPAMIIFVVLSIVLNAVIAIASYNDYRSNYEGEMVNIFEGLKANEFAESYISKYGITGKHAENIRNLYEKLQPVIDEKAANGDALSYYFGEQTYYHHSTLFQTMFMAIIAECCLLAMFASLISITYENLRGTEQVIHATKISWDILRSKLLASLTAAILTSAIIMGFSLFIYFLRFDFSQVWHENVSSMFNFAVNEYGKPFITWQSFTVSTYLWAMISITLGMSVCFCLLGYVSGLYVHNSYGAFITAMLVAVSPFFVKEFFPIGSITRGIMGISPIWLWLNSGEWFTDGGQDIIWANFECLGVIGSLAFLSILSVIGIKKYKKREL